jgi:hypothetical protein
LYAVRNTYYRSAIQITSYSVIMQIIFIEWIFLYHHLNKSLDEIWSLTFFPDRSSI